MSVQCVEAIFDMYVYDFNTVNSIMNLVEFRFLCQVQLMYLLLTLNIRPDVYCWHITRDHRQRARLNLSDQDPRPSWRLSWTRGWRLCRWSGWGRSSGSREAWWPDHRVKGDEEGLKFHLKGEVAWRSVEAELDADGVEDVAREERQPADQERGCEDFSW